MTIHVALHHQMRYRYDRSIQLGPQTIRLRPAPHCRTPIRAYSLRVEPDNHFLNWQQDPHGNYVARAMWSEKVSELLVEVDLVAEMTVINPFDFFLEPGAEQFPFAYEAGLRRELQPFLETETASPELLEFVQSVDRQPQRTIDFLVGLNQRIWKKINYVIRMEPGVQTPHETLTSAHGSCRDSAWLMVEALRHLGLAARFASGYLIQLKADTKPLDGPAGVASDFTDLHAWAEVFLPGAGWIGLDPTSGLLAGEGHVPLACTPRPSSAAPITGTLEACTTDFDYAMHITRIHEDPRVTLPYSESAWQRIQESGHHVDAILQRADVRLTMGGEPTFVSTDDMESAEWQTEAMGPTKRRYASQMLRKLRDRFTRGALLYTGQGKLYPGEPLPRWAFRCYWRLDGEPIWREPSLLANEDHDYGCSAEDAHRFCRALAARLGVDPEYALQASEDAMYYLWRERCLPPNVNPLDNRLDNAVERQRVTRLFQQGLTRPVGSVLPLRYQWYTADGGWQSGRWHVRADELFLIPGDSPMGYRLPLKSLTWQTKPEYPTDRFERDPMEALPTLPDYQTLHMLRQRPWPHEVLEGTGPGRAAARVVRQKADTPSAEAPVADATAIGTKPLRRAIDPLRTGSLSNGGNGDRSSHAEPLHRARTTSEHASHLDVAASSEPVVPTALCVEPRQGRLYVFLPPTDRLEHYLDLIAAIEDTAEGLQMPVVIEGYPPPHDPRVQHFSVTPDPGVIEVNVHPAGDWNELVEITSTVYEMAREVRLSTEKFDRDGTHTGTGGGNHVVLGGRCPADSPFLRRPDLLRSLLAYWHNHPSLSYLFSGRFVGPTSQAPRVDEGRQDARYELQIAMDQIPTDGEPCPPWLVDRIFRHLLVDGTGNTHRAEFCIDKLYSPDTSSGRLGLLEFRAFEMPPHARMSLTQQLLLRMLIARFWETPYRESLADWKTALHDRFMLPHFLWQDFADVVGETERLGYDLELEWFAPHCEFRFPKIGEFSQQSVHVELRSAIEPWYVLGEESAGSHTARYVDSSVERMQVLVRAMTDPRHAILCNGHRVPLHPTGRAGEYVAGIRYRAWQPPHCLHPTIPVDEPLVFDLVDCWQQRSLGGGRYHVGHPGGLNPDAFPVNAFEAESRRAARFLPHGHTPGSITVPPESRSAEYPLTLDLRRTPGRSRVRSRS